MKSMILNTRMEGTLVKLSAGRMTISFKYIYVCTFWCVSPDLSMGVVFFPNIVSAW